MCLEPQQAAVIQAALTRFELLKQAYVAKTGAYQGLLLAHEQDSLLLTANGRLVSWYQRAYRQERNLHQEAVGNLTVTQHRATRRGLLAGAEAVVIALLGYSLLTK